MVLWCLVNCGFLYYAINQLNLKKWQFALVILVSVNDVFMAVIYQQYSIGITAMIILSYVLLEKERDFWAALVIVIGTFTKLYGIVGLAFSSSRNIRLGLLVVCSFGWLSSFYCPWFILLRNMCFILIKNGLKL